MRKVSERKRRERGLPEARKYGAYFAYVKSQYACALAGHPKHKCFGPIDAHHVVLVSQGGLDEANLLPLCRLAHDRMHALGSHELFDAEWNIYSAALALIAWEKSPWGRSR